MDEDVTFLLQPMTKHVAAYKIVTTKLQCRFVYTRWQKSAEYRKQVKLLTFLNGNITHFIFSSLFPSVLRKKRGETPSAITKLVSVVVVSANLPALVSVKGREGVLALLPPLLSSPQGCNSTDRDRGPRHTFTHTHARPPRLIQHSRINPRPLGAGRQIVYRRWQQETWR